jgi:hypothetical protein
LGFKKETFFDLKKTMAAIIPAMTSKPMRTGMITAAGETFFDFFLVVVLSKFDRVVFGLI